MEEYSLSLKLNTFFKLKLVDENSHFLYDKDEFFVDKFVWKLK